MSDKIMVRWESEDGWREGVLVCCSLNGYAIYGYLGMRGCLDGATSLADATKKFPGVAILWDRHRNESHVVPLDKLRLIPPRCPKCDGEGWVDVATVATTMRERCECQRVPNAS